VYDIMSYARKRAVLDAWQGPELLHVRPALDGLSTFDFTATEFFLEEGYRATRDAIAASSALVPRITEPRMEQAG